MMLMRLRSATFAIAHKSGVLRLAMRRKLAGGCYVILAYHGVSERACPLFTSMECFRNHLRFMRKWGSIVSLDDLCEDISQGRTRNRLCFVITFDDGYANVARNAVPLLRENRVRAAVFVNPGWIDAHIVPWWFEVAGDGDRAVFLRKKLASAGWRDASYEETGCKGLPMRLIDQMLASIPQGKFGEWWRMMCADAPAEKTCLSAESRIASWEELNAAADALDVGSHTLSHAILGKCADAAYMRAQIKGAKERIEEALGKPCRHFAYPRGRPGDFTGSTRQALVDAGFITGLTTVPALATRDSDLLELPRFFVGETSVAELTAAFTGLQSWWDDAVDMMRRRLIAES